MANLKSLDQLVGWVARHKGGRSVVGQVLLALIKLACARLPAKLQAATQHGNITVDKLFREWRASGSTVTTIVPDIRLWTRVGKSS